MSKRTCVQAELASPRDLRNDPWFSAMAYTQSPSSHADAQSSQQALVPPFVSSSSHYTNSWNPQGQSHPHSSGTGWYTREGFIPMSDVDVETIHTQTFQRVSKGFGVNTEHQLQIVEQCAHGVQRNRRPEGFWDMSKIGMANQLTPGPTPIKSPTTGVASMKSRRFHMRNRERGNNQTSLPTTDIGNPMILHPNPLTQRTPILWSLKWDSMKPLCLSRSISWLPRYTTC